MHDVIIIGGGPTGSHAARRLAENGYKTLVLEKNQKAGGKACCTGVVGQECVNAFEIDPGVIIRRLNSATLFSPSGHRLRLYREEPQAAVLDRAAFNTDMAERAQRAGAEYRFNHHATGIALENDYANVLAAYGDKEQKIPARAVVLAAGFNPNLNERLGLGAPRDYAAGAQVEIEIPGLEETEVYFGDIAPGFFSWLVPTENGRGRIGLLARHEPGTLLKKWLRQLQEQGRITNADTQIKYGGVPLKPPARTFSERLLAIGDAAGQVKPLTGGGIYYGLIGAETAAETLRRALEADDLSAKSLARYERAWKKKLGGELKTGYRARKLFERAGNKQIDRLFRIIKGGGVEKALLQAPDISFDWHSKTVAALIRYQVISKTLAMFRLTGKIDRERPQ